MKHSRAMALAAILTATCLTHPAIAQSDDGSAQLGDIVVTARKSSEKLQEVPLAITALGAETLERSNTRQIRDVATLTPGLSIAGDGAERGQQPSIRGLTFAGDQNQEGNVAVMLDGFYISNPGVMSMNLMEFERVEIVKGPQSALYGHNAFGGAINYVPKAPPTEFKGRAQFRVGTYGTRTVLASVGGTIIPDLLTANISGTYDKNGGPYRDPVNNKRLGGFEKKDAALQVRVTPGDRLTVDIGFYYGDDTFGRAMQRSFPGNCAPNATGYLTQYCGEVPSVKSLFPVVAPTREPADSTANDRKVKHARIRGTYDMDFASLVVSGSYFDTRSRSFSELHGERDGIPFQLAGTPAGTVNLSTFFGGALNNTDYEFDLRLASKQDQPLRWGLGVYYYQTDLDSLVDIGIDSDPIPAGRTIVCPLNFACMWLTPGGRRTDNPGFTIGQTKQASAFASVAYDITDTLTASAEIRYTEERKKNDVINVATTTGPAANPDGDGLSATFKFWTPRFTVNYQATPDNLIYASLAKGSKSGGFNQRAILQSELTYGPETNWTYEIGLKNTLFDRRVRLNLAAFYIDWTQLQVQVPSANPATIGAVTQNFGSVKALGGEIEMMAQLFRGVTVNGGIAYTNPKNGSDSFTYSTAFCASQPQCAPRVINDAPSPSGPTKGMSLDGLLRVGVSKWQITSGFDVNKPLIDEWTWFASANYKYESRVYTTVENLRWIPPRHTLTMSAGIQRDNLRMSLWAQNALDDLTPISGAGNGITRYNNLLQVPSYQMPDRRRIGLTVETSF